MEKICVRPQKFFKATEKIQASSEKLEGNFSQWMAKNIFLLLIFHQQKRTFFCEVLKKNKDLVGGIFLELPVTTVLWMNPQCIKRYCNYLDHLLSEKHTNNSIQSYQ